MLGSHSGMPLLQRLAFTILGCGCPTHPNGLFIKASVSKCLELLKLVLAIRMCWPAGPGGMRLAVDLSVVPFALSVLVACPLPLPALLPPPPRPAAVLPWSSVHLAGITHLGLFQVFPSGLQKRVPQLSCPLGPVLFV